MCRKSSKNTLEKYNNCIGKPAKIKLKNIVNAALIYYYNCIGNLARNTIDELQRILVLSAIHHDYSGSLHTFCKCKKYIESTVGTRTHVKPVFFTVNLFAVLLTETFLF